jgi:hypothetical protein
LPDAEFHWRVHFMIGAMAHTLCSKPEVTPMADLETRFPERISQLTRFLIGGFRAPAAPAPAPTGSRIEVIR